MLMPLLVNYLRSYWDQLIDFGTIGMYRRSASIAVRRLRHHLGTDGIVFQLRSG